MERLGTNPNATHKFLMDRLEGKYALNGTDKQQAKANKIIAESRLLAEDDTKAMTERLTALKAAVAEEKRVADLEVATQNKKVEA